MKACVHCAEQIQDDADICRHCGRPVPRLALRISHRGQRYGIGSTESGYGVWDIQSGGDALANFTKDEEGWGQAWAYFQQLDTVSPRTASPTGSATNGYAIASLVLGIVWLYGIGSLLALIFGVVATGQIERTGQQGRGMAIAGIVLGIVGLSLLLLVLIVGFAAASPQAELLLRI
jgi:hypothetical protein